MRASPKPVMLRNKETCLWEGGVGRAKNEEEAGSVRAWAETQLRRSGLGPVHGPKGGNVPIRSGSGLGDRLAPSRAGRGRGGRGEAPGMNGVRGRTGRRGGGALFEAGAGVEARARSIGAGLSQPCRGRSSSDGVNLEVPRGRRAGPVAPGGGPVVGDDDQEHVQADPDPAEIIVTRVKTSPALVPKALEPAHAAERTGQAAPLASLDQHQADEEQGRDRQQDVRARR